MKNHGEFLKSLNKGNKVAISNRGDWTIGIVEKITPTGKIVVANINGYETTFDKHGYGSLGRIEPLTKEMIEERMRLKLVNEIKNFDFKRLLLDQALAVNELLNHFEQFNTNLSTDP